MRVAAAVRGASFHKVEGGKILRFFDKNGQAYTGLKVSGEQCDGVLFLEAPPSYQAASIFWVRENLHPWDYDMMLEFPDAVLTLHDFTKLPAGKMPETGALTIDTGSRIMFLSKTDGSVKYVDMKTGETFSSNDGGAPPVVVSKWSINISEGTEETLLQFPEKSTSL